MVLSVYALEKGCEVLGHVVSCCLFNDRMEERWVEAVRLKDWSRHCTVLYTVSLVVAWQLWLRRRGALMRNLRGYTVLLEAGSPLLGRLSTDYGG